MPVKTRTARPRRIRSQQITVIAEGSAEMLDVLGKRGDEAEILEGEAGTHGTPDQSVRSLRAGRLPDTGRDGSNLPGGIGPA